MKKILLIEDEYIVRSSIRELLENNDYKVFSASDGIEGIQLAKELIPDLILCDVMMPGLNGYEVIEKLRTDPKYTSIPFVFLTAKAELTDMREGMELGADDYIVKPFRAVNLLKAIETRLNKFESMQNHKNNSEKVTVNEKKEDLTENDRLFIKANNGPQIIKVGDILCISAQGEYSFVYLLSGTKYMTRKLVKQWEKQLPGKTFLRIHRSTIININYIDKIEKWYKRSYMVILKNFEKSFIISQRYASKIKTNFDL
jgi:DNA-binding LytR/AlgR family response regulator